MEITLARALKLKNRLAEKISEIDSDIIKYNRIAEGNDREINVQEAIKKRSDYIDKLIKLKVDIFNAGNPIRKQIFGLSELKAEIAFLRSIPTERGKHYRTGIYQEDPEVEYGVELTKADIDAMVKRNESLIDSIQFDIIDAHNSNTMIEIDFDINSL